MKTIPLFIVFLFFSWTFNAPKVEPLPANSTAIESVDLPIDKQKKVKKKRKSKKSKYKKNLQKKLLESNIPVRFYFMWV